MTSQTTVHKEHYASPLLLDKAFFGKGNCLTIQVRKDAIFLKWGVKSGSAWDWKSVKFSDVEIGEILGVLDGRCEKASFFHSFNGDSTKIWVSRQDSAVVFKAEDYVKGLQPGEQVVMSTLLKNSIWLVNLA